MIDGLPNTRRLQPLADLRLIHRTALTSHFPAILEQDHCGYAANAKLPGRSR